MQVSAIFLLVYHIPSYRSSSLNRKSLLVSINLTALEIFILIQIVICLNTYGWKYPIEMTVFFSIVFKDDFSLTFIFFDLF